MEELFHVEVFVVLEVALEGLGFYEGVGEAGVDVL